MRQIGSLIFFLAVVNAVPAHAQQHQFIPFEIDDKWGYKTASGTVTIKPQYNIALEFLKTGIAAIADDNGWAYVESIGAKYWFDRSRMTMVQTPLSRGWRVL